MTHGNREVKTLARTIQDEQGIPYNEALHQAERKVHLDLFEGHNNGSLPRDIAETWMPVLTRLKPTKVGQWQLINAGPGINQLAVWTNDWVCAYLVGVSGPTGDAIIDDENSDPQLMAAEDLVDDELLHMDDHRLDEAFALHAITGANGVLDEVDSILDEETLEHLDLRPLQDAQERIDAIVEFLNGYVQRRPMKRA